MEVHWREAFRAHHRRVPAFFAEHAPAQFFQWDIRSNPSALADYLSEFGIHINPDYCFRLRETDEKYYPEPLNIRACRYVAPILPRESGPQRD